MDGPETKVRMLYGMVLEGRTEELDFRYIVYTKTYYFKRSIGFAEIKVIFSRCLSEHL